MADALNLDLLVKKQGLFHGITSFS